MTYKIETRLFDTHAQARQAVNALENAGFSHDEVSIMGSNADTVESADTPAVDGTDSGAGTGASVGTVVGGGVGLLAGLGALAIPGVGPIVAAGWLVALVTGAGAGAAAGGLLGSLTNAGVDEADAPVYAEGMRRGGSIVTVRADESRIAQARMILDGHAPVNIAARSDIYRSEGWTADAPDGTPGNPLGTMASRAVDDTFGTNVSGARPENERGDGPDGTAGNPRGTAMSRGVDDALGTNVSGARPENDKSRY